MADRYYDENLKITYSPQRWEVDLSEAGRIFADNISANLGKINTTTELNRIICKRMLSKAELSVASRHYYALNIARRSNRNTFVVEDDIEVCTQPSELMKLFDLINHYASKDFYVDVSDSSVVRSGFSSNIFTTNGIKYSIDSIARTKSLMGYALSPPIANALLETKIDFALPVDMDYQIRLLRCKIQGFSAQYDYFQQCSKNGKLPSSIQP